MRLPIKTYFSLLAKYLRPQWLKISLLTIFLFTGIIVQIVNPQLLRYFIDTATQQGTSLSLVTTGILFLCLALANQAIAVITTYLSTYVAWTATNQLRSDLVAHCLSLDMAFHKARSAGEFIERIDGDVNSLSNFFSQFVISLLSNLLLLMGVLALLFQINWLAGTTLTLFACAALFILMYQRHRAIPRWIKLRQVSTAIYAFLSERLQGREDIRANGAIDHIMHRFFLLARQWFPVNRQASLAAQMMSISALFLFVCGNALALIVGAFLWWNKSISLGTVYLIFAYTELLAEPISQIQTQLQDLQQAEACIARVQDLLHTRSALKPGEGVPIPGGPPSVDFRDISFSYTDKNYVLKDISFQLEPGSVLSIVGRTGSGKTTLAHLLFRLYDPQSGEICLNGVPIHMADLHQLRKCIGLVTQEVQVFHASVRDNLTLFNHSIPNAQILEVIEKVGLSAWLQTLDNGLDTYLGVDGTGLSAGQAQLLVFARVFLADPGLIILDEASSRLDPATDCLIEEALDHLLLNRTVLIIAHRLSTIQRADTVLIIEDGHILEFGKRKELMEDPQSHLSHLLSIGLEEIHS